MWVNPPDINISSAQIPVGSKISGSLTYNMNAPAGGGYWSKTYMTGDIDDARSNTQTVTLSTSNCDVDEEITWTCN